MTKNDENSGLFKEEKEASHEGERNADVVYLDELQIVTKRGGRGGRRRRRGFPPFIVTTNRAYSFKYSLLSDFVEEIKMEPCVPFDCISLENIYETKTNQATKVVQSFDILYKVGVCRLMGSTTEFFNIIDKFSSLNFGLNELVIRDISAEDMQKEPKSDTWKSMVKGTTYREVMQAIDSHSILTAMNKKGILFKDMIDYVIDDSGEKDPILVALAKASRLPIMFSLRPRIQPFNCNIIIFANSGTGKSLAFQRMLGREAPQTISAAGLFGGFTPKGGINPGLLDGEGVLVIDEAGRKTKEDLDGELPILEKALTYTETGEAIRGLVTPIACRGTKSIVIIGNSDLDDSEMNGLERFITRKFTEHANNRVGRRFPIVVYRNDMPYVHKKDFDANMVTKCRLIVDAVLAQNRSAIAENLIKGLRWCSVPDKKFEAYFNDIARRFRSSVLREYTQGIAIGYGRVKFAALKIAVFDHMDGIALTRAKKKKNVLFGEIMKDAKENYEYLVQEIQRSFTGIKESPYDKMVSMIDKDSTVAEISKETGLSSKTVYRHIERLGKMPYKKKSPLAKLLQIKKEEDDKVGF
jgi:hypothetical protein